MRADDGTTGLRTPARPPRRVALALTAWAACYAAYRFYYAFGGQAGMVGRPSPAAHFRRDNLVGGAIILLAAVLPAIALKTWCRPPVRRAVAVVGWIAAVGCCMHALTLMTLRVLSLTDVHPIHYPAGVWLSIDRAGNAPPWPRACSPPPSVCSAGSARSLRSRPASRRRSSGRRPAVAR
jgi:hypothetical protein